MAAMVQASEEIRALLAGIRGFLLDMDGTFYLGEQLLDGSLAFLDRLRATGRSALFVTNNSSKSGGEYVEKLRRMGVEPPFLRVLTSGQAAGRYVLQQFAGQKGFVLGSPSLCAELEEMGLEREARHPAYVLIGYDTTLDYRKLCRVCDLVREGLPYIATHPDVNCPTETGYAPDIGAVIAFVKASTGREPDVVLGKPNPGILQEALAQMGLCKQQLAMVGDRLYTDIATGVRFGMTSVLVLTGETRAQDVAASPVQPTLMVERLASLVEYL